MKRSTHYGLLVIPPASFLIFHLSRSSELAAIGHIIVYWGNRLLLRKRMNLLQLLLCTISATVMAYNDVPYYMGIHSRPENLPDRIVCFREFNHTTHSWTFLAYQWFDVIDHLNIPKSVEKLDHDLVKLWLYRDFNSYAMFKVRTGRTLKHPTATFLYAVGPHNQVRLLSRETFSMINNAVERTRQRAELLLVLQCPDRAWS